MNDRRVIGGTGSTNKQRIPKNKQTNNCKHQQKNQETKLFGSKGKDNWSDKAGVIVLLWAKDNGGHITMALRAEQLIILSTAIQNADKKYFPSSKL